jgi:class 3 adenylate cyclase
VRTTWTGSASAGSAATALHEAPQLQSEERKVVSVLFVALVGFMARSHYLDPEDVRAALAPYRQRLKTEIERFGGTVESTASTPGP